MEEFGDDCICFGLCDLGMGTPELGYVILREIVGIGFIERDLHFDAKGKPMSYFVDEAEKEDKIVA